MPPYTNTGPVDCNIDFHTKHVERKTAVITGGAGGIGEAYTCALVKAGAFVVIADRDVKQGSALARKLGSTAQFVQCDVTLWKDQLAVFHSAASFSPNRKIDIVIANAGIDAPDSVFQTNVELDEPEEPQLTITNVNTIGVLYTTKLALHYFRRQNTLNKGPPLDQLLILQSSMAGYLELPGSIQYSTSKHGLRSILKTLRMTEWEHKIRVAIIAPWFIKTNILPDVVYHELKKRKTEFATLEDAGDLVLRIAADPTVTGRSFAILPRSRAPRGYLDLDSDDYNEGGLLEQLLDTVTGTASSSRPMNTLMRT